MSKFQCVEVMRASHSCMLSKSAPARRYRKSSIYIFAGRVKLDEVTNKPFVAF